MTQTSNRLLDEFARLATDAAAVAQGVRREAGAAFRSQAERLLADMDVVSREEHEIVKAMASRARSDAEALAATIEKLEARIATLEAKAGIAQPMPEVAIPGSDSDA